MIRNAIEAADTWADNMAGDQPEPEPEAHRIDRIAQIIRASIERQVRTTGAGKALTAANDYAVAQLVTNLVGNLAYAVDGLIDDALEGVLK